MVEPNKGTLRIKGHLGGLSRHCNGMGHTVHVHDCTRLACVIQDKHPLAGMGLCCRNRRGLEVQGWRDETSWPLNWVGLRWLEKIGSTSAWAQFLMPRAPTSLTWWRGVESARGVGRLLCAIPQERYVHLDG